MRLLGSFHPLGGFILVPDITVEDLAELTRGLGDEAPAAGPPASPGPLATLIHESTHSFQIFGTPFGQFWVRALKAQLAFGEQVLRALSAGRARTARVGSRGESAHDEAEVLRGVAASWRMIDRLQSDLLTESRRTVRQALPVAGRALRQIFDFGYLDRSGFQAVEEMPELGTNLSADAAATPSGTFKTLTTVQLLEAHSSLFEKEFLLDRGDAAAAARVDARVDAGQQSFPLQVLAFEHGEVTGYSPEFLLTFLALVDLALFAPLDPALAHLWSSHFLWEDLHPAYRFRQAAALSRQLGLLEELSGYESYQEDLCDLAGWRTPGEIVAALGPALARSGSVYDRLAAACFEARRDQPALFASGLPSGAGLASPLVIFKNGLRLVPSRLCAEAHIDQAATTLLANEALHQMLKTAVFEDRWVRPAWTVLVGLDVGELVRVRLGPDWAPEVFSPDPAEVS